MTTYPHKYSAATYATGPITAEGTYVTGFKRYSGARTDYLHVSCTCTPYGTVAGVGPFRTVAEVDLAAYEHAVNHVC